MITARSHRRFPYSMNPNQAQNEAAAPAVGPENPPTGPSHQNGEDMDVVQVVGGADHGSPPQIQFAIESFTIPAAPIEDNDTNGTLMDSDTHGHHGDQEYQHQGHDEDPNDPPPGLVHHEDPGYGNDSDYEGEGESGFDGDQEMEEPIENSPLLYQYPRQSYNLRLGQHEPLVLRFHPSGIVPWIALLPLALATTVQVEPAGPWGG